MNNWNNEYMAEYHRQDILDQAEQIRFEEIAITSRVYRARFFERTMFNFANWMISAGNRLRKRYEIPCVDCSKSQAGTFAPW